MVHKAVYQKQVTTIPFMLFEPRDDESKIAGRLYNRNNCILALIRIMAILYTRKIFTPD